MDISQYYHGRKSQKCCAPKSWQADSVYCWGRSQLHDARVATTRRLGFGVSTEEVTSGNIGTWNQIHASSRLFGGRCALTTTIFSTVYLKGRQFIKQNVRKLDQALFEFEFESGTTENVLKELRRYQNPDGGFGNALEPDMRCVQSSAVATVAGLQILSRLGATESHTSVQAAIQYLVRTFDVDTMSWPSVPREVDTAPHAPWWNYSKLTNDELQWANGENVNASIVGFLLEHDGLVPVDFLANITRHALNCLELGLEYGSVDVSFVQFAERLSGDIHDAVFARFAPYIQRISASNPDEWNIARFFYLAHPSQSRYVALASQVMPVSIEYIISTQCENGSWPVGFSWGNNEGAWEQAETEWRGIITRGQLSLLRRYGAFESRSSDHNLR